MLTSDKTCLESGVSSSSPVAEAATAASEKEAEAKKEKEKELDQQKARNGNVGRQDSGSGAWA